MYDPNWTLEQKASVLKLVNQAEDSCMGQSRGFSVGQLYFQIIRIRGQSPKASRTKRARQSQTKNPGKHEH